MRGQNDISRSKGVKGDKRKKSERIANERLKDPMNYGEEGVEVQPGKKKSEGVQRVSLRGQENERRESYQQNNGGEV